MGVSQELSSYVGRLFRRILRRGKPDPYALAQECWESSFRWFSEKRLPRESTSRYGTSERRGEFAFELRRTNLFAWVTSRVFRYTDLTLEGRFVWDTPGVYSAAGFILRHNTDDNFYHLLVSSRGYFRFDLVFNGNPMPLIGWTEIPSFSEVAPEQGMVVRAIVRGGSFSFYLDDEWIGEVEDETIPEGRVGAVSYTHLTLPTN